MGRRSSFRRVALTAAPSEIPRPFKQQLKVGGRLLAPVGTDEQALLLSERNPNGSFEERSLLPVPFVAMTGQAQQESC